MKRSVLAWELLGFGVTSLGGTLLHFLYEWTNENMAAAIVSGVNESTFEHIKLIFWPMFVFSLVQRFFFKEYNNFWCVKLTGILTGCIAIPILFYTYNGIFGRSPDWLNITIFFVSAFIAYFTEIRLFHKERFKNCSGITAFLILCIVGVLFICFTFYPPAIPFFADPLTGEYGIM